MEVVGGVDASKVEGLGSARPSLGSGGGGREGGWKGHHALGPGRPGCLVCYHGSVTAARSDDEGKEKRREKDDDGKEKKAGSHTSSLAGLKRSVFCSPFSAPFFITNTYLLFVVL